MGAPPRRLGGPDEPRRLKRSDCKVLRSYFLLGALGGNALNRYHRDVSSCITLNQRAVQTGGGFVPIGEVNRSGGIYLQSRIL